MLFVFREGSIQHRLVSPSLCTSRKGMVARVSSRTVEVEGIVSTNEIQSVQRPLREVNWLTMHRPLATPVAPFWAG